MQLKLFLNGILVAYTAIDPARGGNEAYLREVQRYLLMLSQDMLLLMPGRPVFYIEVPPSSATSLFEKGGRERGMQKEREVLTTTVESYKTCVNLGKQVWFSTN
jgi:hypothetical protein